MIHLIGEYHFDINRSSRFSSALEKLKPDHITYEITPEFTPVLENMHDHYLRHHANEPFSLWKLHCLKLQQSHSQLTAKIASRFLYNIFAPWVKMQEYVKENSHAEVHCIEFPTLSEMDTYVDIETHTSTLMQEGTLLHSSMDEWSGITESMYVDTTVDPNLVSFCEQRDEYMDEQIRDLEGTVVHFGGLDHMFGDYNNLYERLKPLGAKRYKLNEFEK
jgi:hypothetical protein